MDHLAREILETIEFLCKKGTRSFNPETGTYCTSLPYPNSVMGPTFVLQIPYPYFCQPPVDFEKKQRLRGMSSTYRLPEGLTAGQLQDFSLLMREREDLTPRQKLDKMTEVWKTLTDHNPALKTLRYNADDFFHLYHLILGVASSFNRIDIQNFMDLIGKVPPALHMNKSPEYKNLAQSFYQATADMHWVAAPESLLAIHDQLKRKSARPLSNS
jgi:hypothetical protein